MLNKFFLLSFFLLFLITFSSCEDDPCDFDISGTYTFQIASCEGPVYPQTITISNSATEFTFEGSVYTISECEVTADRIESERMVTFDDEGFDFEGNFETDNVSINCEGRYSKN